MVDVQLALSSPNQIAREQSVSMTDADKTKVSQTMDHAISADQGLDHRRMGTPVKPTHANQVLKSWMTVPVKLRNK